MRRLIYFSLLILWGVIAACSNANKIPQSEYEALAALFDSTGGPKWQINGDWLYTKTPCSWYRVECLSGHVVKLDLSSNRLAGRIPAALAKLTKLHTLRLRENQLSGSIPPELGNLSNLQELDLSINKLTGHVPPELGKLTNLKTLVLAGNQLDGNIPHELANLINVTILEIGGNKLSGTIPPELGNLTKLEKLDLGDNKLKGEIPPELGKLISLKTLSLHNNRLKGEIPHELANLKKLEELRLFENRLSGNIPKELGELINLTILSLSNNQLNGSIPAELGKLGRLSDLNLGGNNLFGFIPPELGNLISLQYLNLADNPLFGEIPLSFVNLKKLQALAYTYLCEPTNEAFKHWLSGIRNVSKTSDSCIATASEYEAWAREQGKMKTKFAILTSALRFNNQTYYCTFSKPYPESWPRLDSISVQKGSLVRIQNKPFREMHLIDGEHLASTSNFSENDFTMINDTQRDSILSKIFDSINILCVINKYNYLDYAATILPDGRLVNYAGPSDYGFYDRLIFKEDQEIFLYRNGHYLATSKIIDQLDKPPFEKDTIISFKPIQTDKETLTPNFTELLKREKNLSEGESYYDYELIDVLDLDNDGINELLFEEGGYEAVSYSIYKYLENRWQVIYKGGGFSDYVDY